MIQIKMPRGDYRPVSFQIKNLQANELDEIYITFKKNSKITEFLFQKRLSTGDITKDEQGIYHFGIMPEDTEDLNYGDYFFDIEVFNQDPLLKETIVGTLKLTDEITHKANEV